MNFTHLHVHSNYSTFDGLAKVVDIVDKCIATGMNAVAITDHGNMRGAKKLLDYCKLINRNAVCLAQSRSSPSSALRHTAPVVIVIRCPKPSIAEAGMSSC